MTEMAEALAAHQRSLMAQAWRRGHTAGRNYQLEGHTSDTHDPEYDNPYGKALSA